MFLDLFKMSFMVVIKLDACLLALTWRENLCFEHDTTCSFCGYKAFMSKMSQTRHISVSPALKIVVNLSLNKQKSLCVKCLNGKAFIG